MQQDCIYVHWLSPNEIEISVFEWLRAPITQNVGTYNVDSNW